MAYQCRECSYQGKRFPGGACPACGSLKVKVPETQALPQTRARPPYRLALGIALWLYLAVEIFNKVSGV